MSPYEVIIIGAGPAGLNAALVLGRCRRRVLVMDANEPRNAPARALHGYLSRDGIPPLELRRLGREQLQPYPTVELRAGKVRNAQCGEGVFTVTGDDGQTYRARKLILATGVVDELPEVEGMRHYYGRGVHHCPYCDGWEVRDQPLAVYGKHDRAWGLARKLLVWSRDLVACSDGTADVSREHQAFYDRYRIRVKQEPLVRVEGDGDWLQRLVFADGEVLPRKGLFFNTGQFQRCGLPEKLGCDMKQGSVETNLLEMSSVPGLYVIGDASRDVQLAIVAAAEGAKAAFAVNEALVEEDYQ